MEDVVPQHRRILVDVVHGELDRGHHAPADLAFADVVIVREEPGDVNVRTIVVGIIARLRVEDICGDRDEEESRDGTARAQHVRVSVLLNWQLEPRIPIRASSRGAEPVEEHRERERESETSRFDRAAHISSGPVTSGPLSRDGISESYPRPDCQIVSAPAVLELNRNKSHLLRYRKNLFYFPQYREIQAKPAVKTPSGNSGHS